MSEIEVNTSLSSIESGQHLSEFRELVGGCNSYLTMNTWSDVMAARANTLLLVLLLIGLSYMIRLNSSSWQTTEILKCGNGLGYFVRAFSYHHWSCLIWCGKKTYLLREEQRLLIVFVAVDLIEDYVMKSVIICVHSFLSLYTNSDFRNRVSVPYHLSHQICIASFNHLLLHIIIFTCLHWS
jgi:hypothetical protein